MDMNLKQSPQMLENEDNTINFSKNCYEEANEHKLDEPNNDVNAISKGIKVQKKVHQFYFVKFRPYEQSSSARKIRKAEKLIQKLDHDRSRVKEKLEEAKSFERRIKFCRESNRLFFEGRRIENDLESKTRELISVQLSLDKLCFSNKAYQPTIKESCLLGNELDKHKLSFRMLHSCKSLAEERRLMRDIKTSQKRSVDCTKKILEVEKIIANAPVNGEICNSLRSKKVMQCERKFLKNEIAKLMQENLEHKAKVNCFERKRKKWEEVIESMERQIIDMERRTEEARELIHNLGMQYGEENVLYYKNRNVLKIAITLVKKKNISALVQLSRNEVEDFMLEWNKSKSFRDDYEKGVLPWLHGQR